MANINISCELTTDVESVETSSSNNFQMKVIWGKLALFETNVLYLIGYCSDNAAVQCSSLECHNAEYLAQLDLLYI